MGLFRTGKTGIISKFYRTDLVICSHSREGKTPSYSQINMVTALWIHVSYHYLDAVADTSPEPSWSFASNCFLVLLIFSIYLNGTRALDKREY